MGTLSGIIHNIFEENGLLKNALPSFEFRTQQLQMADEICNSIVKSKHLIIEAGTGIGKSLAYLAPFALWAHENDKKVIISTYTKTLQEQLVNKDIPLLKKVLGIDLEYAIGLGGENYLCLRRLKRAFQQELFDTTTESKQIQKIFEWSATTSTGSTLDLGFEPFDRVWSAVKRESDLCRGRKCPHQRECFYIQAKKRLDAANLIVVNHHLFFTNIAASFEALPPYDAVVFDEAHNIEDVAANFLGIKISNHQIDHLLNQIFNPKNKSGVIKFISEEKGKTEIQQLTNAARQANATFTDSILAKIESPTFRVHDAKFVNDCLSDAISDISESLEEQASAIDNKDDKQELLAHSKRAKKISESLKIFMEHGLNNYVYWIESNEKTKKTFVTLNASPLNISEVLNKTIFSVTYPTVLVSATLAIANSFEYHKNRWGLNDAKELLLTSPFNYMTQMALYINDKLPDPQKEKKSFLIKLADEIERLVKITNGRALVLFTSYESLQTIYTMLSERLEDMTILKQGDLPRWHLLEKLKKLEKAVLFGTASFWQGIDVPGIALESVIITKLPFAVPNHPLTQARMEEIERSGGNPFMDYQIPQAALMLKQGFGRLIRHRNDIGIISILDPRIVKRRYGQIFLDCLPKCKMILSINDLEGIYKVFSSNRTELNH